MMKSCKTAQELRNVRKTGPRHSGRSGKSLMEDDVAEHMDEKRVSQYRERAKAKGVPPAGLDSEPAMLSNEIQRTSFTALRKRDMQIRDSLSRKFLKDSESFDRLTRRWREADEEGSGFIDKETFINVLFIQMRASARPDPEETEWLCEHLRGRHRLIAYREVHSVIQGDYFNGSSYMPMWATARVPHVPAQYVIPTPSSRAPVGWGPVDPTQTAMQGVTLRDSVLKAGHPKQSSTYTVQANPATAQRRWPDKAASTAVSRNTRRQDAEARLSLRRRRKSAEHYQQQRRSCMQIDAESENERSSETDSAEPRPRTRPRPRARFLERQWPDSDSNSNESERWATEPGSVGEWLRYVASPLERRNFEELLHTLEDFMYDRGLQQRNRVYPLDGVVLRLGSMLHAKITFHLSD